MMPSVQLVQQLDLKLLTLSAPNPLPVTLLRTFA
jgi:hypothetical protein